MDLLNATVDGRFRVVRRLGAGGMGEVYLAVQESLDRNVALKVMKRELAGDRETAERFRREARAIGKVRHDNVVVVYDTGACATHGVTYIAMELLEGETLRKRIRRGALPADEALRVGREIALGLGAAHAAGIVHRDVKPENVMLTSSGAKVLDFGIARPSDLADAGPDGVKLTQTGHVVGTAGYVAPELALGTTTIADAKADMYALGVVLFEMLTGRVLFDSPSPVAMMLRHASEAAPAPGIANDVDAIVLRLLSKEPAARPTAQELARELSRLSGAPPTPSRPAPPPSTSLAHDAPTEAHTLPAKLRRVAMNPWFAIEADDASRVLRLVRSPTRIDFSDPSAARAFDEAAQAMKPFDAWNILLDMRSAPRNNDPDYEQRFLPQISKLLQGRAKVAGLLATASGVLQAERFSKITQGGQRNFTDEATAIAWLTSPAQRPAAGPWEPPPLSGAWRRAVDTPFYIVDVDDQRRLIRSTRTPRPLDLEDPELIGAIARITDFARPFERREWALLSDMRAAPGRNDPDFEARMKALSEPLYRGWRKVAMVLKTATGFLQAQRVARVSDLEAPLRNFSDGEEAVRWLLEK